MTCRTTQPTTQPICQIFSDCYLLDFPQRPEECLGLSDFSWLLRFLQAERNFLKRLLELFRSRHICTTKKLVQKKNAKLLSPPRKRYFISFPRRKFYFWLFMPKEKKSIFHFKLYFIGDYLRLSIYIKIANPEKLSHL